MVDEYGCTDELSGVVGRRASCGIHHGGVGVEVDVIGCEIDLPVFHVGLTVHESVAGLEEDDRVLGRVDDRKFQR